MKTQNKKWGQERKYDVKTEKCVKKIHCVCFYSTVNFFSGPFEMTKTPNLSLTVARFPTEVFKWSSQVYQLASRIVSKQIAQIHRISFEKGTPRPIGCNLDWY